MQRRTRIRRLAALLAVLAGSLVFAVVAHQSASGGTAEVVKPPSLYVSPTGNDSGRCTREAPCASWNRAYQIASAGSVIEVAGGRYPGQLIRPRASLRDLRPGCSFANTGQCVVFQPAGGATVSISERLEIRGSSVWVRGTATPSSGTPTPDRRYSIKVAGYVDTEADSDSTRPDHVLVEGVDSTSFGVFNVDTATFRDLDVGPATVGADCRIVEGPGFENKIGLAGDVNVVPRNIVLDGLFVHNQNRNPDGEASDCHFGGLFLVTANGLVLRNSAFSQNAVYNIQVQNFEGPAPRNIRLENNIFGCPVNWLYEPGGDTRCDNQADIQFNTAAPIDNWLLRFNSFASGIGQYVDGTTYSNVRILGNVGGRPSECYAGMSFVHNTWIGGSCSRTDTRVSRSPFVSTTPGAEDFRLVRGARAAGSVPPGEGDSNLHTDIELQVRPLRFPRDAGAYQRDTAVVVLGRSIGSARMGMPRTGLIAHYGRAVRTRSAKLGERKLRARLDNFLVPGGILTATTVNDRVVGISTRSAYYTTLGGLGPGSPATDLPRVGWAVCGDVVRRNLAGTTVAFRLSRGKRPKVVELAMVRRNLALPCTHQPKR